MSFDRKEYETERPKQTPREDRQTLTMIHQAALKAEQVTGDPAWDQYLSYLQSAIEKRTQIRTRLMTDLANPSLVNAEQINQRRIMVFQIDATIDILNVVISLPSDIKKLGSIAAEKLKTLVEPEGAEA